MTDARVPERYLNDRRILRLSPDHFRALVMATLWSVSNRTDGIVDLDDLDLIPGMTPKIGASLVESGLWSKQGLKFVIIDFLSTQTSKHDLEVLENARRSDREKKARQRAAKLLLPRDDPRDVSPGQHRKEIVQGQAGTQAVNFVEEIVNQTTGEITELSPSWHVAEIGKGKKVSA